MFVKTILLMFVNYLVTITVMGSKKLSWRYNLGYLVNALADRMRLDFETQLAPHKITRLQWLALRDLYSAPHRPAQLARKLGCDRAVVTRLLEGLQERGLITRTIAEDDRRNIDVALTESGRALTADLIGISKAVNERFLKRLTKQQARDLMETLSRILSHTAGSAAAEVA